jgi:hypothetical protein
MLTQASYVTQNTVTKKAGPQNATTIKAPDFADPEVKKFCTVYSNHLIKCVEAMREKTKPK